MTGIRSLAMAGLLLSMMISPSLSYPPLEDYPSFSRIVNREEEQMKTSRGIIIHILATCKRW